MIRGAKPGDRVKVLGKGRITGGGQAWRFPKDGNTGTVVQVNRWRVHVTVTVEPDHLTGARFRFGAKDLERISEVIG